MLVSKLLLYLYNNKDCKTTSNTLIMNINEFKAKIVKNLGNYRLYFFLRKNGWETEDDGESESELIERLCQLTDESKKLLIDQLENSKSK